MHVAIIPDPRDYTFRIPLWKRQHKTTNYKTIVGYLNTDVWEQGEFECMWTQNKNVHQQCVHRKKQNPEDRQWPL